MYQNLIKSIFHGPVELNATRVKVSSRLSPAATQVPMLGRFYKIELLDENGIAKELKGVKRFSFEVEADDVATFSIEYYD